VCFEVKCYQWCFMVVLCCWCMGIFWAHCSMILVVCKATDLRRLCTYLQSLRTDFADWLTMSNALLTDIIYSVFVAQSTEVAHTLLLWKPDVNFDVENWWLTLSPDVLWVVYIWCIERRLETSDVCISRLCLSLLIWVVIKQASHFFLHALYPEMLSHQTLPNQT